MAEAVVDVVLANLSSLIQKELDKFLGVDREIRRLCSILTAIKAVLEEAEEQIFTSIAINNWLHKLRDAAQRLDDILEEYSTKAFALEYQGHNFGSADKVHSSCLYSFHPSNVVFRCKIAKKMEGISEILNEIAEQRLQFRFRRTDIARREEIKEWRQTDSVIAEPQVFGRDKEKEKIVSLLVGEASNSEDVSVYLIVGMGGLGKTTLAQLVFKDERIVNQFEPKIWICVSEDFSLKRILKAIIESVCGNPCEDLDLEPLQKRLQELLGGKRYLLVLDNVWNEDQDKWDKLKYALACGLKGASILVTTRLQNVGSIIGARSSHELSILTEDDCWQLFKQRAFEPYKEERVVLLAMGKDIVKKCKGVPFAAKALGDLLRFKTEPIDWLRIKDSKVWRLQQEYSILPALRLCYLNLPAKLRWCFAYLALFPKDTIMSKDFVIQLWMSNGFISSNEDDGEGVWRELYLRSFFEDVEDDGNDTRFKMHDLLHDDMAQFVIGEECCCIVGKMSQRTRHLLYDGCELSGLHQAKFLRTFLTSESKILGANLSLDILNKCCFLRVLKISHLKNLSSSIGHLKLLRYLNLSYGDFETLPNSICGLRNLKTLDLYNCVNLQKLPNRFKCLKSLRYLVLKGCTSLSRLPLEMGQLTCLKTSLDTYIVGEQKGLLSAELGNLKLKGRLHIKHLERVRSVMEAKEANMGEKHLNELKLSWEKFEESQSSENVEQILEVLQPQAQHLQRLLVRGYFGTYLPQWMSNLTYLRHLELMNCEKCLRISPLEKLPSLQKLKFSNINHLQYLDDESNDDKVARGFNELKELVLQMLPNLIKLSRKDDDNMFPCLSTLYIFFCPKLSLPRLPSVTELDIHRVSNNILLSIQNLRNLKSLRIFNNEELTSLPDGMLCALACLKELHISLFPKLEVLLTELSKLNAIEKLRIMCCKNLETLTEQALQLKRLQIWGCAKFKSSTGFQYLTALEHLDISYCQEVEELPEALQQIMTLQSLNLFGLPNLASLPDWLGNLRSVASLWISKCPKLRSLPMSIKSLSRLKDLKIWECPELQKRCKKGTGEDWHKIAHVSHIHFGYN